MVLICYVDKRKSVLRLVATYVSSTRLHSLLSRLRTNHDKSIRIPRRAPAGGGGGGGGAGAAL
eukprot:SAG31_NODE_15_length_37942_cov_32.078297_1_plen_62_part_10